MVWLPGILLAALFFVAALLYASVGHGGGSAYLAVMALAGVSPQAMRPTALLLNVLVAGIGTAQFARAGHFSARLFWPFAAGSIPLAFLGGMIAVPGVIYRQLLGGVLLFAAARLAFRVRATAAPGRRPMPIALAIPVGAALGLLAGLTGVGGGIFLSPLLLIGRWAEPKTTAAVSAAFILVNSIAGLLGRLPSIGHLPPALPAWAAAVVVGGVLGSGAGSRRLASLTLRRLLAVVLVVAGVKLLLA